jgi:hypothetical protein
MPWKSDVGREIFRFFRFWDLVRRVFYLLLLLFS